MDSFEAEKRILEILRTRWPKLNTVVEYDPSESQCVITILGTSDRALTPRVVSALTKDIQKNVSFQVVVNAVFQNPSENMIAEQISAILRSTIDGFERLDLGQTGNGSYILHLYCNEISANDRDVIRKFVVEYLKLWKIDQVKIDFVYSSLVGPRNMQVLSVIKIFAPISEEEIAVRLNSNILKLDERELRRALDSLRKLTYIHRKKNGRYCMTYYGLRAYSRIKVSRRDEIKRAFFVNNWLKK